MRWESREPAHASDFLGVAFLGVAFFVAVFLGAAAFLGAAFFAAGLAAGGALVLVTRPDLVLPRTRETSLSTAGAAVVFRGLLALALGFAAAFLGAAFAFVSALGFAAVFFVAGALVTGLVFFSTLGSAFFAAAGLGSFPSFFASFTVPEAPEMAVSDD